MKSTCALCGRPLIGMTLCEGGKSYHPDCFKETAAGRKIELTFAAFKKQAQEEGFDKAIKESLNR
jgi:hypothetical protein